MEFASTFTPLAPGELSSLAAERKRDGWRFVQILATKTDDGFDLVYSFMKGGHLENFVMPIQKDAVVPSITDQFLAAFVFENEIHDLFGVTVKGIAIDFGGNFYKLAQKEPMTVMSPAQKAARDKAAKLAAAKAAKAAKEKEAAANEGAATGADAALEAKLAGMDPEKAAKVRAAMEAKAKAQAAKKAEDKLADLDPEKAAKVRAALEAKAAKEKAKTQAAKGESGEGAASDSAAEANLHDSAAKEVE